MEFNIRPYHRRDLESLKAITVEGFEGVSLDHAIERVLYGEFAGRDWRWRKARHMDEDVGVFAEGVFVAEANGAVAGYYWSTRWRFSGRRNWRRYNINDGQQSAGAFAFIPPAVFRRWPPDSLRAAALII